MIYCNAKASLDFQSDGSWPSGLGLS